MGRFPSIFFAPILILFLLAPAMPVAGGQSLPAATHIDSIENGNLVKIITIYPIKVFPLEKKKGEDSVGTQDLLVNVDAGVSVADSAIEIRVTAIVTEDGGAGSVFSRTEKKEALIVGLDNPDYTVVGFEVGTGKVNATVSYEQTGWIRHGGEGIIQSAECLSNSRGPAVGQLGCKVEFNPVRLVMKKNK